MQWDARSLTDGRYFRLKQDYFVAVQISIPSQVQGFIVLKSKNYMKRIQNRSKVVIVSLRAILQQNFDVDVSQRLIHKLAKLDLLAEVYCQDLPPFIYKPQKKMEITANEDSVINEGLLTNEGLATNEVEDVFSINLEIPSRSCVNCFALAKIGFSDFIVRLITN